jgi:hypothetical protein
MAREFIEGVPTALQNWAVAGWGVDNHGLINYIETKAKRRHLKKLTRGAMLPKAGRKYQHVWLYLQCPVYKLYLKPVKTRFRVWRLYSYLAHGYSCRTLKHSQGFSDSA